MPYDRVSGGRQDDRRWRLWRQVLEMFGAGTACIVCPVERVRYLERDIHIPTPEGDDSLTHRILSTLSDIQYGRVPHPWSEPID